MEISKKPLHPRARVARSRSRRIALIYDARSAYDTKVMAGVATYLHEAVGWNVYIEENALKDQRLPDLGTWKGDGIIANFDHPRVAAAVVKSRLPAVGFGSGYGWYSRLRNPLLFYQQRGHYGVGGGPLRLQGAAPLCILWVSREPN